jgi:hypothetical protein
VYDHIIVGAGAPAASSPLHVPGDAGRAVSGRRAALARRGDYAPAADRVRTEGERRMSKAGCKSR